MNIALCFRVLCLVVGTSSWSSLAAEPIRVACLGDSVTFGTRVDPARESYPVQLQAMLGSAYEVKNFGAGGATMWHGGPKNSSQQLPDVVAFRPVLAIVMFGVNDTRKEPGYWPHFSEFTPDTEKLLETLLALPTHPHILLCLPTASSSDLPGLTPERRAVLEERKPHHAAVRAALTGIAQRFASRGVELVDLFSVTEHRPELHDADGLHFNPAGYRELARVLEPRVIAALATAK